MIGGTTVNIEILVGLPGSGKTYYAQHLNACTGENFFVRRIDFDEYYPVHPGIMTLLKKHGVYNEVFMFNEKSLLVFDGLFTTRHAQERIVSEWINDVFDPEDENKTCKTNIKFIYFKLNRDACLKNDSYRDKERSAKITIKHMLLDKPDVEWFRNKYNDERFTFEIEEREVYTMNDYDGVLKPLRNSYWSNKLGHDTMTSEEWCTGGTLCSYDGWESEVEPEKQPQSFKEFDDLLEKLCPGISFLTYKKLYNECVTIEDSYENDYYGGRRYYSIYCCNLELLYDMLKARGYLTEEEK